MKITNLSEIIPNGLDELSVSRSTPLVVVFTAGWCGSCYIARSIVEKLITQFKGKINVVELDIEKNKIDLQQLGFVNVPITIFARGGKIFDALQGVHPQEVLFEKMLSLLSEN